MSAATACFVVTGEFITDHARTLWADENNLAAAVRFLLTSLPELQEGQALSILAGRHRLAGDSSTGVELLDDEASLSPMGKPLPTLLDALDALQEQLARSQRDFRDLTEITTGSGVLVPSPNGTCIISRATANELKQGLRWRDVRVLRYATEQEYEHGSVDILPVEEPEPFPPPPPIESHPTITDDSGWLSPAGRFYPCGYSEHVYWAGRICEQLDIPDRQSPKMGLSPADFGGEPDLEKLGWIKLAGKLGALPGDRRATDKQCRKLLDWYLEEGRGPAPYWLEPDEGGGE